MFAKTLLESKVMHGMAFMGMQSSAFTTQTLMH